MRTLIKNIGTIYGILPEGVMKKEGPEMNEVLSLDNACITVRDGKIESFGKMRESTLTADNGCEGCQAEDDGTGHYCGADISRDTTGMTEPDGYDEVIDAGGGFVMPSFCDSHTHIVYAGCRDGEFRDKIDGLSYEEIAARGGGILNSADLLHRTSEDELYRQSAERAREVMLMGTGSIEIKSGYGLTVEDELKMLRVIRRLKEDSPMEIRSTFLGAHAVGRAFTGRQADYVDHVCNEMLPAVAAEGLADFVDVFCDKGFFTPEETAKILEAAGRYGLVPKIHANELAISGGVQTGTAHGALSVDHLEQTGPEEVEDLKRHRHTMPTMLPGASFFSSLPFGNAKGFIREGLGVALASDYNPGSSPSGNMRFVMSLACIRMRLTPEEAFNACTINSAYAMGVSGISGSITPGKRADLIITGPLPSFAFIPYSHQTPFISRILVKGQTVSVLRK